MLQVDSMTERKVDILEQIMILEDKHTHSMKSKHKK